MGHGVETESKDNIGIEIEVSSEVSSMQSEPENQEESSRAPIAPKVKKVGAIKKRRNAIGPIKRFAKKLSGGWQSGAVRRVRSEIIGPGFGWERRGRFAPSDETSDSD